MASCLHDKNEGLTRTIQLRARTETENMALFCEGKRVIFYVESRGQLNYSG